MEQNMDWSTILFLALLCSLPAVLLLWSALHVGKRGDDWGDDDDTPAQSASAQPIRPQTD
jgi:hypothetical protein